MNKTNLDVGMKIVILGLSILGLLDAIYLVIIKLSGNQSLCIEGIGDCWSVNTSTYSEFKGIPISFLGLLAYLGLAVLVTMEMINLPLKKFAPLFEFGITLTGFLFSIYLEYVQFGILETFCPFCVLSAIIMTALFILSTIRLIKNPGYINF